MTGDMKHGIGKVVFRNGNSYEGRLMNNTIKGKGKFTDRRHQISFEVRTYYALVLTSTVQRTVQRTSPRNVPTLYIFLNFDLALQGAFSNSNRVVLSDSTFTYHPRRVGVGEEALTDRAFKMGAAETKSLKDAPMSSPPGTPASKRGSRPGTPSHAHAHAHAPGTPKGANGGPRGTSAGGSTGGGSSAALTT